MKQRLAALERKMAETGMVLTEAQVVALEKKREDDVACGEIETAHPGYLGSQDTFYVGTLKGVGRIYQQTFVDTCSKWAAAKLYTTKTPITAADLLNDHVLPAFEEQGMSILRILTDRGTEFCGKGRAHLSKSGTCQIESAFSAARTVFRPPILERPRQPIGDVIDTDLAVVHMAMLSAAFLDGEDLDYLLLGSDCVIKLLRILRRCKPVVHAVCY